MRRKIPYFKGLLIALLIGVASWALYSVFNDAAGDLLFNFGITNSYYQSLIVIGVILIILIILGISFKKSFDRVIRG